MMVDLRCCRTLLVALLAALAAPAMASAQEQDPLYLKVNGVYNAWFQNQNDFFLGRAPYEDQYVVQMLRLGLTAGHGDYIRAVTRIDLAQGWWGYDNSPYQEDFNAAPSPSARFGNKDTNYMLHVDHAFLEFSWPDAPVKARVGRMFYGLGNRLILDSNFDGIQLDVAAGPVRAAFGWAKVSEGVPGAGISDLEPVEGAPGRPDGRDADLLTASFTGTAEGGLAYTLYGMRYDDRNALPFFPNRIDYFVARFTPAISTLNAVGASATYTVQPLKLRLEGEANYLFGTDDLDRANSGPAQLLDVNDGDLRGYNLYTRATLPLHPRADLGLMLGMGSGDDDVTSGTGNVNKFKTMGFFYITDVWEQSIMPDEEGITPQGLGAPNVRGYRELENTTLVQVNATVRPADRLRASTAFTVLRATEPIRGWVAGPGGVVTPADFTDETSQDIGTELDFLVGYKPYGQLDLVLRGGYMWAGDGAQLLINGVVPPEPANPWQLKAIVQYNF